MGTNVMKGGILTVATLFGGLLGGLLIGDLVFRLIPGSSVEDVQIGHAIIAAVPALGGFVAGGAAWGVQMVLLSESSQPGLLPILKRLTRPSVSGY